MNEEEIKEQIQKEQVFGFVRCDVRVPDDKIEEFSEFPPVFKNTEITIADIGDHMQEYCRSTERKTGVKRSLIGSMHAQNILLLTPLVKEYLDMGLIVENIEELIEFNGKSVFGWFMDEIIDERRMADLDPDFHIRGLIAKLMGNSGYGRTLMDPYKHTNTTFVSEENVPKHVANPFFKNMTELNDRIYEVEKKKKTVVLDLPLQIGVAVYNYAKLLIIQFWRFLNKYLMKSKYELCQMDTDSLYFAISEDSIDECVKPELKEEWVDAKKKWFPSTDTTERDFNGHIITEVEYTNRTPGLFKLEFSGDGIVALNSKVYIAFGEKDKVSCKGVQQKRNVIVKEKMKDVLETQKPQYVTNAGFIKSMDNFGPGISTYIQRKTGYGYFYCKRKIESDGVSTTHLDI